MRKKMSVILPAAVCLLFFLSTAWAGPAVSPEYFFWDALTGKLAQEAWRMMDGKPEQAVVLTNSGYVMFGRYSPRAALDGLSRETGCTPGKGDLLEVHTARTAPLWFLIYDLKSGKAVYSAVNKEKVLELLDRKVTDLRDAPSRELFSKLACETINADYLFANAQAWDKKMRDKVFDGNEYRIISIVNAVAKGAPNDLVKSALYHDHFCPGVTSGYVLANFLEKELPLRSAAHSYFILSTPVWCKEDALQTVLNTTPGKSGMAVLPLNKKSREMLAPDAKNLAGIYFRTDRNTKQSEALILTFDFAKAKEQGSGDGGNFFGWEKQLKTVLWGLDNLDKPDLFITVLRRFKLPEGEAPQDYIQPGVNPLERLGLVQ